MTPRPPLALHLALALAVTWPLARAPREALLGHPDADVWNHAWGPWWWWQSLSTGALPWRTGLLGAPEGGVLWFIDPLLAALGAPLVPMLGVAAAWNAALLLSVALTSWSGAVLARALGDEGRPVSALGQAVSAAALAASCPVVVALHNGVSEALHLGPLALGLAAGEAAIRAPEPRRALLAGAGVGLLCLLSPYSGLGLALALAARGLGALIGAGRRGRGRLLRAAGLAAGAALASGLPALGPLFVQLAAEDALVRRPEAMDLGLALHNALDPRALLLPLFASVRAEEGFATGAYLGLLALGLALLRPRPAWLGAALLCAITALGPWLSWGGSWVELGGERLPLPFRLLQLLSPAGLTHPGRLVAPALAIVAGLAGGGADRLAAALGARRGLALALVPAVALDGLLLSGAPWPVATAPAGIPAVYAEIRAEAGEGVLLDLPTDVGATMATSRYLYWQTAHGRPIPYAPDARASTARLIDDPSFRALAALCRRRADEAAVTGLDRVEPGALAPERLRDRGVRWIVLHPTLDPEVAPGLEAALRAALGPPRAVGDALRWDLVAPASP